MRLLLAVFLFASVLTSSATAQETERLGSFDVGERERLAPLLARGSVALVEFAEGEALPAVILASYIDAPASEIAELLDHPERYPSFMGLLKSTSVTGRHEGSVAFDWTWQTAVFELRGTNQLTRFDPPASRPSAGYRFEMRSNHGDLGMGRISWRILPEGDARSLVLLSMRLDLRDANYLSRQMATASRSVNRAANMSLAYLMLFGVEREAERAAPADAPRETPPPQQPFTDSPINVEPLLGLLDRGDLVVFHGAEGEARSVTSIGRMWSTRDRVREVVTNPVALGTTLIPGASAQTVSESDHERTFDWEIAMPLIGSSGRMRLTDTDLGVDIAGVSGSLGEGRWSVELRPLGPSDIVLVTTGRFDPGDTSWLLRGILSASADFGHGLASACELMLVRAVRTLSRPQ